MEKEPGQENEVSKHSVRFFEIIHATPTPFRDSADDGVNGDQDGKDKRKIHTVRLRENVKLQRGLRERFERHLDKKIIARDQL